MNQEGLVTFTVYRYSPKGGGDPTYQSYSVPVKGRMTVLQALEYIYEHLDSSLGFREYCCGVQYCNSCRMMINGRPAHACLTVVEDKEYLLEPLSGYRLIRDLIVDWEKKD